MKRCIHCGRLVWFWQRAIDPSGHVRDDVHAVCRKVADAASEQTMTFCNSMNRQMNVPTAGEFYSIFGLSGASFEFLEKGLNTLRKQYGQKHVYWRTNWLNLSNITAAKRLAARFPRNVPHKAK